MTVTVSGSFYDPSYPGTYPADKVEATKRAFDKFRGELAAIGFAVGITLSGAVSYNPTTLPPVPTEGEFAPKDDSEE